MNNRTGFISRGSTISNSADTVNVPRLTVITAVMALGGAAGSIYAAKAAGGEYFNLSAMYGTELFKWQMLVNFAPVLAAFLSSYFGYGAVLALASVFCRGFMLTVPLTDSVRQNGIDGYFGAFSLCGIISVVAVIIMSMQAIEMSSLRRGGRSNNAEEYAKNTFSLMVCFAAAIVLGAALDAFLLK